MKASELTRFDLDWWISKLLPITDKLIKVAVDGEKDPDFWDSIFSIVKKNFCGQKPRINGWITNFFPYVD